MNLNRKYALHGADIWDGVNDALYKATILIEGRKIKAILRDRSIPDGYAPIDITGSVVVPGLFDMHGHFYGRCGGAMESQHDAYCPLFLAGGVTTVRTPGEFQPYLTWRWKQDIEAETRIGPRILTAGAYFDMDRSSVHWIKGHSTEREFREQYEMQREYMDFAKVYSNMPKRFVKLVCDMAHKDGFKVYGHLGNCTAWDAMDVGLNGLEHGFYTMSEFYGGEAPSRNMDVLDEFDPCGKAADKVISKILECDVAITPTVITFMLEGQAFTDRINKVNGWQYADPELVETARNFRPKFMSDPDAIAQQDRLVKKQYKFVSRIVEAGGRVFAGTDPSYPMLVPGEAIVWEAENLRRCDMSNLQIMKALTIEAAKEMNVDTITGTIEPYKEADLCVLKADPLAAITNLSTVYKVMKGGRLFDSAELRNSAIGKMK